jgi:hypothetical protein
MNFERASQPEANPKSTCGREKCLADIAVSEPAEVPIEPAKPGQSIIHRALSVAAIAGGLALTVRFGGAKSAEAEMKNVISGLGRSGENATRLESELSETASARLLAKTERSHGWTDAPIVNIGGPYRHNADSPAFASSRSAAPTSSELVLHDTPFPNKQWLTGTVGPEGVWSPIRSFEHLPENAKVQLAEMFGNSREPLLNAGSVDHLVASVVPILKQFKPVTDSAVAHSALAERLELLSGGLNKSAQSETLPRFLVEGYDRSEAPSQAIFRVSNGSIALRNTDILQTSGDGIDSFTAGIAHEKRHGAQIYKMAQVAQKQAGISKADLSDPMYRGELMDFLASQVNVRNISPDYAERLARTLQQDTRPVTALEEEYADKLGQSYGFALRADGHNRFATAGRQADETTKLIRQLGESDGTARVIAQLQNPETQMTIGLNTDAASGLNTFISDAHRISSPEQAHSLLLSGLQDHAVTLNQTRQTLFAQYMGLHELEAFYTEMQASISSRRFLATPLPNLAE